MVLNTTLKELFKPALLRWQLRQLLAVNVIAVLVASLYVVFRTQPLFATNELLMPIAIFVHSSLIVWTLGRVTARHTGFLYAFGFTRDQICWQTLIASGISGLLVCATAWLLMVTGLRCAVQDRWYLNVYFPFIAPEEYSLPWVCLIGYAVLLPMMHYVWIRANLPIRGGASGWMLLILGLYFQAWSFDRLRMHTWESTLLVTLGALNLLAALLLVTACWRLHRTMEVRS